MMRKHQKAIIAMTTSKKFRNAAFVATEAQAEVLAKFEAIRATMSIRKQAQYLAREANMTTGEIAKYLEVRFQQIYQATH